MRESIAKSPARHTQLLKHDAQDLRPAVACSRPQTGKRIHINKGGIVLTPPDFSGVNQKVKSGKEFHKIRTRPFEPHNQGAIKL